MSVTGIITTFKRDAGTVEKAIISMLNQTYPLIEIIVVDDNVDNSPYCAPIIQMCSKYENVRYIKQNGNKGACAARNLGIDNSNGDYIGFLDDDDIWLPQKIEKQIEAFNNDSIGLVSCRGFEENIVTGEVNYYYNAVKKKELTKKDMIEADYVGTTSQPLIRKKCFDDVGGFWEEQPARQDYEMWIRISSTYKIVCISDRLFIHIIHEGEQITKSKTKSHIGYTNIYKRYFVEYLKNPRAMKNILTNICDTRETINFQELKYIFVLNGLKLSSKLWKLLKRVMKSPKKER